MSALGNRKGESASECDSDDDLDNAIQIAIDGLKKAMNGNKTGETDMFIKEIHDSFDSEDEDNIQNCEKDAFVIDKGGKSTVNGDAQPTEIYTVDLSKLEEGIEDKSLKKSKDIKNKKKQQLSSRLQVDIDINDLYIDVNPLQQKEKKKKMKKQKEKEPEIMKKSVVSDDYERQSTIPTITSARAEKKKRKDEREKTKGSKWFDIPAQEVTEERTNDFLVYQMRRSLDPKRFYKTTDAAGIPKYYHTGTVVEHAADFYDSRIPKKQRKANMVEELLADAKFRKYNKRKYKEIQEAKRLGTGVYNSMKKLKRKKVT